MAGTATCVHINRSSSSFWVWIQIVFFHSFLVKFVFNVSFIDFNDELSYFKGGLTWKSDVFEYICFACRFSSIHALWVCGELDARRIVFFFNIFRLGMHRYQIFGRYRYRYQLLKPIPIPIPIPVLPYYCNLGEYILSRWKIRSLLPRGLGQQRPGVKTTDTKHSWQRGLINLSALAKMSKN